MAKILINYGADIHGRETRGQTPLHLAAGRDHRDLVALLIRAGANVEAKDDTGKTPLHEAASRYVAKALIATGVNIQARDIAGETPLHAAAASKSRVALSEAEAQDRFEVVKFLIKRGAAINMMDRWGEAPLDKAKKRNGWTKVVHLLSSVGAEAGR